MMLTCFESHDEWLGHFTCSLQMLPKIEMFYFRKKNFDKQIKKQKMGNQTNTINSVHLPSHS